MNQLSSILIKDYDYPLPAERIAKFPLADRDQSKLLIYKNGKLSQDIFSQIHKHLPGNSLILFNETKVIRARLPFIKDTGAKIEIFCLEPVSPVSEIQMAFQQTKCVVWKCFVGNAKRWKTGQLKLSIPDGDSTMVLSAEKAGTMDQSVLVKFSWYPPEKTFAEILEKAGLVPLPPYLGREAVEEDKTRYQTIYAHYDGSVAAPTAGLHFTETVLQNLAKKNISTDKLILHVGAGTFKPVSSDKIIDHEMHTEKIIIRKSTIEKLLNSKSEKIVVVGTTTLRTLESLYWYGVKLLLDGSCNFFIDQWDPYQNKYRVKLQVHKILEAILNEMDARKINELQGKTQLMIAPGYEFKIADILITNFHQPKSTLLLLVSAFIGNDWLKAYQYALNNDFRFLSYGDSCLFFK